MAIESLVALSLATAILAGLAWYANIHRSEKHNGEQKKDTKIG